MVSGRRGSGGGAGGGGRGEGQRRKLALVDEVQTEFIPLMFALSNNRRTTESVFSFDLKSGS